MLKTTTVVEVTFLLGSSAGVSKHTYIPEPFGEMKH
jgi:hypothetical protein